MYKSTKNDLFFTTDSIPWNDVGHEHSDNEFCICLLVDSNCNIVFGKVHVHVLFASSFVPRLFIFPSRIALVADEKVTT